MNCELMLTYDTPAYMFNVHKNQLSRQTGSIDFFFFFQLSGVTPLDLQSNQYQFLWFSFNNLSSIK
jgi:hypothetical protein